MNKIYDLIQHFARGYDEGGSWLALVEMSRENLVRLTAEEFDQRDKRFDDEEGGILLAVVTPHGSVRVEGEWWLGDEDFLLYGDSSES